MRFNLAILSVLAARPEQRIPIDEVSREIKRMIAVGDEATRLKRPSRLGDADVFQSGWVSINDAGLQITDSGLSLWHELEASRAEQGQIEEEAEWLQAVAAEIRPALVVTDDRIDRSDDIDVELAGMTSQDRDDRAASAEAHSTAPKVHPVDSPIRPEPAFGSIQATNRPAARLSGAVNLLRTGIAKLSGTRRRRSADDVLDRSAENRGGLTGLAVACLSLISVVACVAAAIALGQATSLKSDIATLHREFAPLRERLARLEQDAAKRDATQQDNAQEKAAAEKKAADVGSEQAALNLSREEAQLVREYIKAAPSSGTAGPPINVGDPVTGGMIPLPSPLTEKIPKLVGARFATRNGAIIISTRNSRRVDAVLMQN